MTLKVILNSLGLAVIRVSCCLAIILFQLVYCCEEEPHHYYYNRYEDVIEKLLAAHEMVEEVIPFQLRIRSQLCHSYSEVTMYDNVLCDGDSSRQLFPTLATLYS